MTNDNLPINHYGREVIGWSVHEFNQHEKTKTWYVSAAVIGILLLIYCYFTSNFLFAIIIILGSIIIVSTDGQEPEQVRIVLTTEGIVVGRKFYDYDEIKNFSIVYKPRIEVKNLYLEFKNSFKHRLSIPLNDMNPLPIRENLLKYLTEDLERTDQPLSEALARIFKL
jgi:hypothetical protein